MEIETCPKCGSKRVMKTSGGDIPSGYYRLTCLDCNYEWVQEYNRSEAIVAQTVERAFRKRQVKGSTPFGGL